MGTGKGTARSVKRGTRMAEGYRGFSAEERAAMKERARELKAEARAGKDQAAGERALLAKIAQMPEPDRSMAQRLHAVITAAAPALSPCLRTMLSRHLEGEPTDPDAL